jgi:ADP-L-glycero-D-manno-heptose 6-epimerase
MAYIVITGGAGFIGSHVAGLLAARGTHRIVVADTMNEPDKWRNLANHAIHEVIAPQSLFYWLDMYGEQTDAIVHMASISAAEPNVDLMLESHLSLPTLLWKWCGEHSKRFIWGSTNATYGDGAQGVRDDHALTYLNTLRPQTAFAWSKHRFDCYVASAFEAKEAGPTQWVGLKFAACYGANEYHKGNGASLVTRIMLEGGVSPTPSQAEDFIYAKDAANVTAWFIDNPKLSGIFNVGSGEIRSYEQVSEIVHKMLGTNAIKKTLAETLAVIGPPLALDISKLRAAGYSLPMIPLEQGVVDYIQHYWNANKFY